MSFYKFTTFFVLLFFQNKLYGLQFSVGVYGGANVYNNDFYIDNQEKTRLKLIRTNLFTPILMLSSDFYLAKRWRLGLKGTLRKKVSIKTPDSNFINKDTLNFSSSFVTKNISLKLLYEVPFDLKNIGYIGFGVGYSKNTVGPWSTTLKTEQGETFSQILKENTHSSWLFKVILGRSYEFWDSYYIDLVCDFSFLEYIITSSEKISDTIPKEKTGVWNLSPAYKFPIRPLDIALGVRKKFKL